MGIQGLLPFLKKTSKNTHLKNYGGSTAAVDGFGWLHKGAFGCAVKLGMGETTDAYVVYFMKYINVLLEHKIKPVVVFDGRSLPAKAGTNAKRRESRTTSRKKAQELMRKGDKKGAWEHFVKSVEITHEMVLEVIKVLRQKHIDYIVAPYEADAQLAFLARSGFVDFVITEDSDLVAFGCPQIFFKLSTHGDCVLLTQENVHICMDVPKKKFKFEHFRHMCILSGCDYLESLPKIGLTRAKKIISALLINGDTDISEAIRKIPSTLNLDVQVTEEYIEAFIEANNSFLYQLVFDPQERKVKPLNPYPEGASKEDFSYAGTYDLSHEEFFQLALGNIHTKTLARVGTYNIDTDRGYINRDTSIWSKKHGKLMREKSGKLPGSSILAKEVSAMVVSGATIKTKKRPLASNVPSSSEVDNDELRAMYRDENSKAIMNDNSPSRKQLPKRSKRMSMISQDTLQLKASKNLFGDSQSEEENDLDEKNVTASTKEITLQQKRKKNPFLKSPDIGKRARARMLNGSSEDVTEAKEEVEIMQPVCLVEKNHIYGSDKNLVVKSKYFRSAATSSTKSTSSSGTSSGYENEFSQVTSQLSIYSIDKEDIGASDLENTPADADDSPSVELGSDSNCETGSQASTVEDDKNACDVVELEDEEETSSSSYFCTPKITNGASKISNQSYSTSKSAPPLTRGKARLSCRSQGLKKPQKTDSTQRTLVQMFGFQAKPKI